MTIPLKWAGGDRGRWGDRDVVVEYAAEDAALISYVNELGKMRFAIVPIADLELRG
jgi:hypothetical protein